MRLPIGWRPDRYGAGRLLDLAGRAAPLPFQPIRVLKDVFMMAVQWEDPPGTPVEKPRRQRCSGCRDFFPIEHLRRRGSSIALWCDMCATQGVLFPKPRSRKRSTGGGR